MPHFMLDFWRVNMCLLCSAEHWDWEANPNFVWVRNLRPESRIEPESELQGLVGGDNAATGIVEREANVNEVRGPMLIWTLLESINKEVPDGDGAVHEVGYQIDNSFC